MSKATTRDFRIEEEDFVISGVSRMQIERMDKGYWFVSVTGNDGETDHFHLSSPNARSNPIDLRHTKGE